MARRFSGGHVRRDRRKTQWVASVDSTGQTAIPAASAILDSTLAFAEPATIVRVRGSIWVSSDQSSANEEPFGALGFIIVSDAAAAVGVGSLPTPITDEADDGWFVYVPWLASWRLVDATGVQANPFMEYKFDSKAKRKVNEGDTLAVVIENASSADGVNYILKDRTLLMLH